MLKASIDSVQAAEQLVGLGSAENLIIVLNACGFVVQGRYAQSAGWRERNEIMTQRTFFDKGHKPHLDSQTIHMLECLIKESKRDNHG